MTTARDVLAGFDECTQTVAALRAFVERGEADGTLEQALGATLIRRIVAGELETIQLGRFDTGTVPRAVLEWFRDSAGLPDGVFAVFRVTLPRRTS